VTDRGGPGSGPDSRPGGGLGSAGGPGGVELTGGGPLALDPLGVVVDAVCAVERHLGRERVREVAAAVAPGRVGQRRLARALAADPQVLRTGRSPSALAVGRLLVALARAGARQVAGPRCCGCDRVLRTLLSRAGGNWACGPCAHPLQPCADCGRARPVSTRDRQGRPRCQACAELDTEDPAGALAVLVLGLEPGMDRAVVHLALEGVSVVGAVRRRVAWAVLDRPELLTGAGAHAPTPAVLRFVDALVAAGARTVVRPACPQCRRVRDLTEVLGGRRVCHYCYSRATAAVCCRCRRRRPVGHRDEHGRAWCLACLAADPASREVCVSCRQRRTVIARGADGPRCMACRPRTPVACSMCQRVVRCEVSRATGRPWCQACMKRWIRCGGCGVVARIWGGTLTAPLCAACLNPDPAFWDRCPDCRTTWQLTAEPCRRCALAQTLREVLDVAGRGGLHPTLQPLAAALTGVERPDHALIWLRKPAVRAVLTAVSANPAALTHDLLDRLPATATMRHTRAVLVAAGVLGPRDERLTDLQRWIDASLAARTDPDQRRLLHAYAVWHHLRRLRQRLGTGHATAAQATNIRRHVTAAGALLDWLADRGRSLSSATQPDLDRWAAQRTGRPGETAHFLRWATAGKHATGLTVPAAGPDNPGDPHDEQRHWADARRLLHDNTLSTPDRVAGLLVLLYAQDAATIVGLTVNHVHDDDKRVLLNLGTAPIALPPPLDGLVRVLVATRVGHALLPGPGTSPWLFPGGRPGHHLGPSQLGKRLRAIGLHPRRGRATAPFTLAADVPAAILARTVGINIKVAVTWQHAAAGDWTAYAADISRRQPADTPDPT
jgi:hypothetical protein